MTANTCEMEYIWLDGAKPTQQLRSKTKLVPLIKQTLVVDDIPLWSFDGSSTYQAGGENSDLILKPVAFCKNTLRSENSYIVMCEVFQSDGRTAHPTNQRALLRELLSKGAKKEEIWIGFEQEYTFFKDDRPMGWPKEKTPKPQGPYYCGVGTDRVFGRDIVEEHMRVCQKAGLYLYGINAEVMPAQWEFQIGYRDSEVEILDPLTSTDHLWMARWFLYRVAENYGVRVSLDNKPIEGDWNGAGLHTNFSTKGMRELGTGIKKIEEAIKFLEKTHKEHIAVYGDGLEKRLTGKHETCAIDQFKSGVANRAASIRIPAYVKQKGCGYFEDRRPGANADPYTVTKRLIKTVCNI